MKLDPRKAGRGRPKSADRSELVEAQIARCDALARRTRRQVWQLERDHVSRAESDRDMAGVLTTVSARVRQLPDELAAAVADAAAVAPGAVAAVLGRGIDHVLRELAASAPPGATSARAPRLNRSRSLAAARARLARLHAGRIEASELIARGELVDAAEVARVAADVGATLRGRLRGIPTQIAAVVPRSASVEQVRQILFDAIGRALDRP